MFKKSKITSLMLVSCLVFSVFSFQASAKENKNTDMVEAKISLMQKADQTFKTRTVNAISTEEINLKLARLTSQLVDPEIIAAEMETYGVFQLETPDMPSTLAVDNGAMSMSKPSIYYDSTTKEWIVVGGGYWKDATWLDHVPGVGSFPYNVGGVEGFGVGFTQTGGNYKTKVNSHYAYMSDGEGNEKPTYSRSDGDGSKGFGFQLQDSLLIKCFCPIYLPATEGKFSYIGKHFAGLTRYDSNFSQYTGVATSYYLHTYDEASLTSVKFAVTGKTAGIDFNIVNEKKSFPAFSGDTRF